MFCIRVELYIVNRGFCVNERIICRRAPFRLHELTPVASPRVPSGSGVSLDVIWSHQQNKFDVKSVSGDRFGKKVVEPMPVFPATVVQPAPFFRHAASPS